MLRWEAADVAIHGDNIARARQDRCTVAAKSDLAHPTIDNLKVCSVDQQWCGCRVDLSSRPVRAGGGEWDRHHMQQFSASYMAAIRPLIASASPQNQATLRRSKFAQSVCTF